MLRRTSLFLRAAAGGVSPFPYEPVSTNPIVFMDITVEGDHAGRITMELFHDVVPQTAENFRSLCTSERGFGRAPLTYKGVPFHRVIPGFVLQGGDILSKDGRGNESIFGYRFPDESFQGKAGKHLPGTIAMASSGPNENGSQFFFNLKRSAHLDGKLVVFGQVLQGWDVVREVSKACGSRCGTPVSRAWISECGQSGGLHYEDQLHVQALGEAPHEMPAVDVLNSIRPRF